MATATEPVKPLRYKANDAARVLNLAPGYVYQLVEAGLFTPIRPFGKGPGKRLYLLAGEVDAYARGGRKAVTAWRKSNRIPEPKKV